jgi:hypothetical protein
LRIDLVEQPKDAIVINRIDAHPVITHEEDGLRLVITGLRPIVISGWG